MGQVDTLVIGSGPGGYVAAIRLGQLGVKTMVVEKASPGGVCLNVGCIPSKALIHAAKTYSKMKTADTLGIAVSAPSIDFAKTQKWKRGIVTKLTTGVKHLVSANGAEFVTGTASVVGKTADGYVVKIQGETNREVTAKNIVVATGSRPIEIPGFAVDQSNVIDSTGALALEKIPDRLIVIGGGYIGLELGTVYAKLGTKVTVVEAMDSLLASMDPDCVKVVARKLRKMGVEVLLGARASSWKKAADGSVELSVNTKSGDQQTISADAILLSIGRRPNTENIGLDTIGVAIDKRGYIEVDDRLRTNIDGVYAIGDVVGGMMLAHKASKEAEVVAEVIAGHKSAMDPRTIPAVVFTDPEIASTGMTEKEARDAGHTISVGKFPFAALGRALSVNDTDGFAKVIGDKESGEILGMHIVGNGASDLIGEAAMSIEMGAVLHDMALTIHPHPTLNEALKEAAAAALGEAVHIVNR